jgi:hypothetical protein
MEVSIEFHSYSTADVLGKGMDTMYMGRDQKIQRPLHGGNARHISTAWTFCSPLLLHRCYGVISNSYC